MFEWIQTIRYHLTDLHDPLGIHFHRAWKACLAGLFAAIFLYFLPWVGQPLAVVSAMIFAHTTSGSNPRKQQLTMLRAVLLTISGICLLGLASHLPTLQMLLIILLSFLAQYVVRFGSQYSSSLIWILILVAIAEHSSTAEIPKIILNIVIGFLLAFVCFFWIFPYNPQKALITTAERTKLRLGELLKQIVDRLGQDSRQTTNRIAGLKRRIFSLIEAQQSNLKQVKAEHSLKLAGAQSAL